MSIGPTEELPLFPLGLALVPGELRPLHIFEERYKKLIADTRESGEPFGVVLSVEPGLASMGCTARLVGVLEEFEDGRMNVVVRGEQRFRLLEARPSEDPESTALRGVVAMLEEPAMEPSAVYEQEAKKLFRRVLELTDEEVQPVRGEHTLSFNIAGQLELEPATKQRLLELDDENDRLRVLINSLNHIVSRLELLKEREDAIRGNGKGT